MADDPSGEIEELDTRTRILNATEQIMLEEGYAGVSYRKVMQAAGLKSNLLHHYFKTMDDLFIAAFKRREDWHVARLAGAASSGNPLHDLWELGVDGASSKLVLEYNALACHRPVVREVIARSNARDRISTIAALEAIFERYGIDEQVYPPKVVATVMAGLARALATDRALGTEDGHAETLAFVKRMMAAFEPDSKPRPRTRKPAGNRLSASMVSP